MKQLGCLLSMTLVDRWNEKGQRNYLYRSVFQNGTFLQHYVLDGQNRNAYPVGRHRTKSSRSPMKRLPIASQPSANSSHESRSESAAPVGVSVTCILIHCLDTALFPKRRHMDSNPAARAEPPSGYCSSSNFQLGGHPLRTHALQAGLQSGQDVGAAPVRR